MAKLSLKDLCVAYIIAVAFPTCCILIPPTIGFSGVIFALVGIYLVKIKATPKQYLPWILLIAIGFFLPHISSVIHLYAMMTGIIYKVVIKKITLWGSFTKA